MAYSRLPTMAVNCDQAFTRHQNHRRIKTGPTPAPMAKMNFCSPSRCVLYQAMRMPERPIRAMMR